MDQAEKLAVEFLDWMDSAWAASKFWGKVPNWEALVKHYLTPKLSQMVRETLEHRNASTEAQHGAEQPQQPQGEICPKCRSANVTINHIVFRRCNHCEHGWKVKLSPVR